MPAWFGSIERILGKQKTLTVSLRTSHLVFNKIYDLPLDSMTPAFSTFISMKQGEKMQKIVAKYVCDRFRERDRRVKYNLV